MYKLADYMAEFAGMLGKEHQVHFVNLESGSTNIVGRAEHEDVPKVDSRLFSLRDGTAPQELIKIFQDVDAKLANDNATGRILAEDESGKQAEIITFPGCTRAKPRILGPIAQEGSLDGIVTSVVGSDETIHVQLQNGDERYVRLEEGRDWLRTGQALPPAHSGFRRRSLDARDRWRMVSQELSH